MMDIFIIKIKIQKLQQCQSPFIFKSIIKFIKILKGAVQITDYTTNLFHGKIYSIDEPPTPQAMLLSFLAGPINLRKFIATRPEGTRQPDF